MSEWNLSDKIEWKPIRYAIPTEDIQEFIRRLKEKAKVSKYRSKEKLTIMYHINSEDLHQLAGEKLIEKPKAEDDELLKEALKDIEKINKWAKEKLLKKEKKLR